MSDIGGMMGSQDSETALRMLKVMYCSLPIGKSTVYTCITDFYCEYLYIC